MKLDVYFKLSRNEKFAFKVVEKVDSRYVAACNMHFFLPSVAASSVNFVSLPTDNVGHAR